MVSNRIKPRVKNILPEKTNGQRKASQSECA